MKVLVLSALVALLAVQDGPPRILLDQPLRAVEYQLNRLTNDQLVQIERKPDDAKYRPVYMALLTRKGLARSVRDEAVAALTALDRASAARVLLEGLGRISADDPQTAGNLLVILLAQPAGALRQQRDAFTQAIDKPEAGPVLRGAYGALIVADGSPDQSWKTATAHEGHLAELLRAVPFLPGDGKGGPGALGAQLFAPVSKLATDTATDAATRADALAALGWTRRDQAAFQVLARAVTSGTDDASRVAAVHSLQLIPESAWPRDEVEPLARAIVKIAGAIDPGRRAEPAAIDTIQLGDKLAASLPAEPGRAIRRDLRALGVQVVRIESVTDQLTFDTKWFAVEAGKAVQIVLVNPDTMPHNFVVGKPGSLKDIATAGGAMAMPTDPDAKAFIPDLPSVLQSTALVKPGDTLRLAFVAPTEPGEYIYVCTFPGHWIRMYGVMLVVPDLEAWETKPTVPIDPMTNAPFTSRR